MIQHISKMDSDRFSTNSFLDLNNFLTTYFSAADVVVWVNTFHMYPSVLGYVHCCIMDVCPGVHRTKGPGVHRLMDLLLEECACWCMYACPVGACTCFPILLSCLSSTYLPTFCVLTHLIFQLAICPLGTEAVTLTAQKLRA